VALSRKDWCRGRSMKTFRHCLIITFALTLAAGCTSAAGTAPNAVRPRARTVTKTITDRNKGETVTLRVGARLEVVLASTYWTIHPAPKPAVLRTDGSQATTPRLKGCVPGGGCGTASRTFTGVTKGKTVVRASRTSCGEALRCTEANGTFSVSVVVK
jgi:hypothetical protein